MTVNRPFIAINGHEAKQIILREIEKKLDSDWHFRQNVAFPLVRWTWKLDMRIGGVSRTEVALEAGQENGGPEEEAIAVEQERIIEAPAEGQTADAVRREVGIGVPEPRPVLVGVGQRTIVDEPEFARTPEPEVVTVGEEQESEIQTPQPRKAPVVAKRVSLKLRPKPGGKDKK